MYNRFFSAVSMRIWPCYQEKETSFPPTWHRAMSVLKARTETGFGFLTVPVRIKLAYLSRYKNLLTLRACLLHESLQAHTCPRARALDDRSKSQTCCCCRQGHCRSILAMTRDPRRGGEAPARSVESELNSSLFPSLITAYIVINLQARVSLTQSMNVKMN